MGVRIGHRGDRWIELGAWHATTGEALRFGDTTGALLFLRERLAPGDLRTLRALLTREHASTGGLDDAAVLRLVAHRLCTRTLKAALWHERRYSFVERPEVWQPVRIEVPAAEPRLAEPIEPISVVRAPELALPDDWDTAAQAATLRAAARDGAPFCEVCQRPPPARRTQPPVAKTPGPTTPPVQPVQPMETLPADSDAAAQAATLKAAARTGAPFCEICRKQAAATAGS